MDPATPSKRGRKPKAIVPPPDNAPSPPDTEEPLSEASLEEKLSQFSFAEQCNLRMLYSKYIKGETNKWQEEKLREKGIIGGGKSAGTNDKLPLQCSFKQFAAYITEHYGKQSGITYYDRQVKSWLIEGMPKLGLNGRLNSGPCLKWFLENIHGSPETEMVSANGTPAAGQAARNELYQVRLKREKLELEEFERTMDATWIKKEDAQMTVTAAVLKHHAYVKARLKEMDKKFPAGTYSDEQIKSELSKMLENIELDCESGA